MGAFLPASAGPSGGDRERFSRACGAPSWRKAQPRRKQLRNAVSSADEPDLLLRHGTLMLLLWTFWGLQCNAVQGHLLLWESTFSSAPILLISVPCHVVLWC